MNDVPIIRLVRREVYPLVLTHVGLREPRPDPLQLLAERREFRLRRRHRRSPPLAIVCVRVGSWKVSERYFWMAVPEEKKNASFSKFDIFRRQR